MAISNALCTPAMFTFFANSKFFSQDAESKLAKCIILFILCSLTIAEKWDLSVISNSMNSPSSFSFGAIRSLTITLLIPYL